MIYQRLARRSVAHQNGRKTCRRAAETRYRALQQRLRGQRGQRSFGRRLPDHRVAAYECQRRVPRPHCDGEIEGGDHADHTQGMPCFHHPVVRPFGSDGQARKLPRETACIHADVDHLLHLALAFGYDFARFDGDQPSQRDLRHTQFVGKEAHQLSALRSRYLAPFEEGFVSPVNGLIHRLGAHGGHVADRFSGNRASYFGVSGTQGSRGDSESFEQGEVSLLTDGMARRDSRLHWTMRTIRPLRNGFDFS